MIGAGDAIGAGIVIALLIAVAIVIGWRVGWRGARPNRQMAVPPTSASPIPAPSVAWNVADDPPGAALGPDRATLGRYRIERELGRGAMGTVYLAHDPQNDRPVALKTLALSREFEGRELAEARARFFREAEMAGRLQHPDIVSVFEAGEYQGVAFIAMEYVNGHYLLRHTLPGRLLPVPVVLRTLARVAQALAHAHTQGVIHRDVKPANVMIDTEARVVKVTDFGIARVTDACRTRTGLMLGTPSFMSPEQMAGQRLTGGSDLYSLGVMLFQLLTGALPHRSESMAKLLYQIANDTAPDVRSQRPELPEALAQVVAHALEKRPEARHADGHALAADLLAVAATLDSSPLAPTAAGVTKAPESRGIAATAGFSRADPRHNDQH